jgi:hypothetical protein
MGVNPLTIYFDQSLQHTVVQTAVNVWSDASTTTPTLYRNDQYLLQLQVYSDSSTTPATEANLAAINTSSLQLDIGLLGTAPIISINNSGGDFVTTDMDTGRLDCYINTHSANLTASITTLSLKSYTMQIVGIDDSIGCTQNIFVTPVIIKNVVGTGSGCTP